MAVQADSRYVSKKCHKTACGRCSCLILYSSPHCLLCNAALEIMYDVVADFGLPRRVIQVIDVLADEDDGCGSLPPMGLPAVRICDELISGLPDTDVARGALMQAILKGCFHECEW